ncbi:hypothetical protein DEU56DRAFT_766406 [Suillus clintonianus]|uniref:uncharacterized protein n=1 Tax=Suillus clintonianus TaxID=1904413 RepID=UPI001B8792BB|nr:uncharacterized protein DEU56DRAFT_766406 [Suillus clintonianus]KAG2156296.1 hypothetical protein DEU56DRAFT_766406 [Suillus clintonianus]
MAEPSSNVTISLLPVSLSLVHIPRSRLPQLSHPVIRQILQPNPTFINVTCNEIELSLFAESHMLTDFEPVARRDRQRQRSRSGSGSGTKRAHSSLPQDHLEISYEKWNVLQIDSHSDGLDSSGARVHELSAPLAAAGISILYQSSYLSDFIFVKESRLQEVMTLLGSTGFDLYSSDPELLTSRVVSPLLSPISPGDDSFIPDAAQDITAESGAILTRTRNSLDAVSAAAITLQHLNLTASPDDSPESSPTHHKPPSRHKSHSPTSGEVRILSPNLACVGLSDDSVDTWGLKIVKLVAFPELIPVKEQPSRSCKPQSRSTHPPSGVPLSSSSRNRYSDSSDSYSSSDDDDEEGYFSHSPLGNLSSTSLQSSVASRSFPDLSISAPTQTGPFKPSAKHIVAPLAPLSPLEPKPASHRRPTFHHMDASVTIKKPAEETIRGTVPFFSFTRTQEGTSLTTDVSVLAALFPPNERHMMICAGELDALDAQSSSADSDSEDDEDTLSSGGALKCLQIDLRRFGLDKHGLVNRFSRVLEQNGINHMYSSTYKTANLLVSKAHANRARALLKAC